MDLDLLHQKYEGHWVEFKTSKKKTVRSTKINSSHNPKKYNKTEFVEKFALSLDFAQSKTLVIVHMGNYKLNDSHNEEKKCLDEKKTRTT